MWHDDRMIDTLSKHRLESVALAVCMVRLFGNRKCMVGKSICRKVSVLNSYREIAGSKL